LEDAGAKRKEFGPQIYGGVQAEIGLAEGGKRRKCHDGVGRKVVWLKPESIEEIPEEVAYRKSESTVKMGTEDDKLSRFRLGSNLAQWDPAYSVHGDLPRCPEGLHILPGDSRPLPATTFPCGLLGLGLGGTSID
jgi:hypothetical protein